MLQSDIRILIIEDEEIWAKAISLELNDFGYTIAGIATNFEDALLRLKDADSYDVVLLDIMLHGRNTGMEIGRLINLLYKKPFIFMTATHEAHSLTDIQGVQPFAYLTKPVNASSLVVAIQNAINNFSNKTPEKKIPNTEEQSDSFFVKQNNKYRKLAWADVVYLRAVGNYTHLFNAADKTEYPIRSSLANTSSYIIPPFARPKFMQINRSEVIHSSFITEVAGNDIHTRFGVFVATDGFLKYIKNNINIIV